MGYNGYSTFEVVSSVLVWLLFVGAVVIIYRVAGVAEGMIEEKKGQLRAQGVAIETSAAKVSAHRDAFRFGDDAATMSNVPLDVADDNDTSTMGNQGMPPPGSAAADGLAAAKGQGMTTSFGAVRGDGAYNEGQVPVGAGEAVDSAVSGDVRNSKRSLFRRNKKVAS